MNIIRLSYTPSSINTIHDVYTVPTGNVCFPLNISLCNRNETTPVVITLYLTPSESTTTETIHINRIIRLMPAGDRESFIDFNQITLKSGDKVSIKTDNVDINVFLNGVLIDESSNI
jgi:hypothetical protein